MDPPDEMSSFPSAGDAGAHMEALAYVRRMRRMNLTGKSASAHMAPAASVGDGISAAWGLNWADKTFGQGLSSLTKGGPTALCNVMFNF